MKLWFVRTLPDGWQGEAWLMHDIANDRYYVVSRADTFDHGDETMIFASDSTGEVSDWSDLYAGRCIDHITAIEEFETAQR